MYIRVLLFSTLLSALIYLVKAQTAADGPIVPFTSGLPSCASQCGPLWDVQGACTINGVNSTCFCSDSRLQPFLQGTTGVAGVCGTASCTDTASLSAVEDWYKSYCGLASNVITTSAGSPASTGSANASKGQSGQNQSWIATHYQWVIMLIFVVLGISGIWVGAIFFRRRYLRKKEREIEMRPPVAWGPHQMQASTGGHSYGDGINNAGLENAGGHHKEANRMEAMATPADNRRAKRLSKGWLGRKA